MSGLHSETATVRPGFPAKDEIPDKAETDLPPRRPGRKPAAKAMAGLAAVGVLIAVAVVIALAA